MKRKILLRYPAEMAEEPVFATVLLETGIPANILYSSIGARGGEILIGVDAPPEEVERMMALFRRRGVEAVEVRKAVRVDREKCFDCGACLSLCPTQALRFSGDCSLEVEEEKCVCCEACVPACPVRAITVRSFE
ncbi:MAG: [Fe-S]-binding protein [Hadesarchaea archaeon]|jgi:NAD-dependent dihydropyrimidine dehydrogenase PreA subunit|nr:MAG: [Fe-S]-binding protein [Hadesarchaea archaeon]